MTGCCSPKDAEQKLDAVLAMLDEAHVQAVIDQPLERAAACFMVDTAKTGMPFTGNDFLNIITNFMQHIHLHGLPITRKLTPPQARMEVIALLERGYQGQSGRGYDAALADTMCLGEQGISYILSYIMGMLKALERHKHVQWVLSTHIDRLAWEAKCALTDALLHRLNDILPEDVRRCAPGQLADYCPMLVMKYVEAATEFEQSLRVPSLATQTP